MVSPSPLPPTGAFAGHWEAKNSALEVTQYQCKGGNKDYSD